MDNAKIRLLTFLKFLKLGQNSFEEKVGISRGYLSKSTGNIGSDILSKIAETYPELNFDWLITGKGNMTKSSINIGNNSGNNNKVTGNNNNIGSNIKIDCNDAKIELEKAILKIEFLEDKLRDKEEIIGLLRYKK